MKPPFIGDSFPSLKRAVVAGRYAPIPRKYSEVLGRTIALMLRVNPKERLTAEAFLKSTDFVPKLQLDEIATSFAQNAQPNRVDLMETIKVPGNLRQLNCALPKPCYPDVRPNSPSAWTVAEQKHHNKRPPPIPPVLEDNENYNEEVMAPNKLSAPQTNDIYIRRPLHPNNQMPECGKVGNHVGQKQGYQPTLDPVPSQPPAPQMYSKARGPTAPAIPSAVGRPAGHQGRVQYQHRMW